jgi:hypothetical protein
LRAISEGKADAPEQILARWTWRLARGVAQAAGPARERGVPEAKRLLGALANSRGHRHEENAAKLVNAALELPLPSARPARVGGGLHARATQLIEAAASGSGTLQEVAGALAENLPQPKLTSGTLAAAQAAEAAEEGGRADGRPPRRADAEPEPKPAETPAA